MRSAVLTDNGISSAAVDCSAKPPEGVRLRLLNQDQLIIERPLEIDGDLSARLVATDAADRPQEITAQLLTSSFDALASDDTATLSLPALRPLRAWVAPGCSAWKRALQGQEGVVLLDAVPPAASPEDPACDLVIADRPGAPPGMVSLLDGSVPEAIAGMVAAGKEGRSEVVDWRRSDPLLAHVGLTDLVIAQQESPGAPGPTSRRWRPPAGRCSSRG